MNTSKTMIFLIFFILWSQVAIGKDELCTRCICQKTIYYSESVLAVNCTKAGITVKNVHLLEELPDETEVLILNENNIPSLPQNIFGNTKNFTKLRIIDMANNNIEEIKGKTYHHAPLVERLILNHNSIALTRPHPRVFSNFENLRELHLTDAFLDYKTDDLADQLHTIFRDSNLKHLQKLHLEQNEIERFVDPRVFCDLENLTDLYLGNNKLQGLSFEVECLHHLRYIDLESNEINVLTKENLAALDRLSQNQSDFRIDIHKNPFVCDCAQNDLYFWLRKTQVEVRNNDSIECHYLNKPNSSISMNDFHGRECSRISNPYYLMPNDDIHQFTHYFFFSTASILVLALIYLCIKYTMVYCRHSLVPASKVYYVVIKNPDDNGEVHV